MTRPLDALIARWRVTAAQLDTVHAMMGAGWKTCADELEIALAALTETPERSVWLVESGDVEQCGVDGIYESLDAAIAGIKAVYGFPYIVRWLAPQTHADGETTLVGEFDQVIGYSAKYTHVSSIRPMKLLRALDCKQRAGHGEGDK